MSNPVPVSPELVTLTIDGVEVKVPKGTNIIEAARKIQKEIPYYCYHPHLSVAGNCRMCKVKVEGQPKLVIGCNTPVAEGMKVSTQATSPEVQTAQSANLEFILVNHPLDCTVCDQAGHCKLQDYHYEYNAKASRFIEEKEHKVKAVPLGPTVMLDGERCILCTRCVRFCDEITGTSELGVLNRGDRSVIGIREGKELNNPFSGTVVDLCPVGALTHKEWRFKSRIWFTKQTNTICPGCSTGCNARVATRDGEVVMVKGRLNSEVNKEWMCDEGRYGFDRFLPKERTVPAVKGEQVEYAVALKEAQKILKGNVAILLSPHLTLEDFELVQGLILALKVKALVAVAYQERPLTKLESILISPDRAPNFRSAEVCELVSGNLAAGYTHVLNNIEDGKCDAVLCIGDTSFLYDLMKPTLLNALISLPVVAVATDAASSLVENATVVLPASGVLEVSGVMINRAGRYQYREACVDPRPEGQSAWKIINDLASGTLTKAQSDRERTLELIAQHEPLKGRSIRDLKAGTPLPILQ